MSPPLVTHILTRRDVASDIHGVKTTLGSWDGCMAKAYCKWPVIAAIIVAVLLLLSILGCLLRCICCGAECCCGCFRCCNACCPSPRRSRDKYQPAPQGGPPAYPQPFAYQPQQPMYYGAGALPAGGTKAGFATFESAPKPGNEDALPAMPSWSNAKEHRVEVEEEHPPEEKNSIPLTAQKPMLPQLEEQQPMLQSPQPVAGAVPARTPSPFHRTDYNQAPYHEQSSTSPRGQSPVRAYNGNASPFHGNDMRGYEYAGAGAGPGAGPGTGPSMGVAAGGAAASYFQPNSRSPPPNPHPSRSPAPNPFSPRSPQGGLPPQSALPTSYTSRSPPPNHNAPPPAFPSRAMTGSPAASSVYTTTTAGGRPPPSYSSMAPPMPDAMRPGHPRSPPPTSPTPPPPQAYQSYTAYQPFRGAQELSNGAGRGQGPVEVSAQRDAVEAPTSRMTMKPTGGAWGEPNPNARKPVQGSWREV